MNDLAASLAQLLANIWIQRQLLQSVHWNVRGELFHAVHVMTQEQYELLDAQLDEVGERLLAKGYGPVGSPADLMNLSDMTQFDTDMDVRELLDCLVLNYGKLVMDCKTVIESAEYEGDQPSIDLATRFQAFYEKSIWMLSTLGE